MFQLLKQHGALPSTATERDSSSVDFQQLIRCCHELDTKEAEQRASHPSDDSRSELRVLNQRHSALVKASITNPGKMYEFRFSMYGKIVHSVHCTVHSIHMIHKGGGVQPKPYMHVQMEHKWCQNALLTP